MEGSQYKVTTMLYLMDKPQPHETTYGKIQNKLKLALA